MFDGSFAIDILDDFGVPLRVTRRKAATIVKGRAVPAQGAQANQVIEIVAVVQPASGRELQRLPEERRSTETRRLFTTTPLQVGGEGAEYLADLVELDGVAWEVQNVRHWPDSHYDCLVQRPAVP